MSSDIALKSTHQNTIQEKVLPTPEALRVKMRQKILGYMVSQSISVAAELGVADELLEGPLSIEEISRRVGSNKDATYRLLRALASEGIFSETSPKVFALTPSAELLLTDQPGSLRNVAMMYGQEAFQAWGALSSSIRTGEAAFSQVFGAELFDYLPTKPDSHTVFNSAMEELSLIHAKAVTKAYDFSQFGSILDIGGGNGTLMLRILKTSTSVKGAIMDLSSVVEKSKSNIAKSSEAERCEVIAGDFFDSVPKGFDAYLLKYIIHDWSDEDSIKILSNIRKAMSGQGKILLVELVIPEGDDTYFGKFIDLHMLVTLGAKERTQLEYQSILNQSGFELVRVIPTSSPMSIIEAVLK